MKELDERLKVLLAANQRDTSVASHACTEVMERRHRKVSVVQCFGPLTLLPAMRKSGPSPASPPASVANGMEQFYAERDGHVHGRPLYYLPAWLCVSTVSGTQPIACCHNGSNTVTTT